MAKVAKRNKQNCIRQKLHCKESIDTYTRVRRLEISEIDSSFSSILRGSHKYPQKWETCGMGFETQEYRLDIFGKRESSTQDSKEC